MKITTTLIAALAMTACAKLPEDIQAVKMQGNFDCVAELSTLAELETAQRKVRGNDVIGVILLGVPVGSLAGNNLESEIAVSKGRVAACN